MGKTEKAGLAAIAGIVALAVALAQPAIAAAQDDARPGAAAAAAVAFAIPPQPLADALALFGEQSGMQVSVDGAAVRGIRTGGVTGRMSRPEALDRLLADTGLTWRQNGAASVTLFPASSQDGAVTVLEPITVAGDDARERATGPVEGYVAQRSRTGTKTDAPLVEVPQSISVVTADQIAAQGARNVEQALSYTAGVTVGSYGPNPEQDYIFSRGFVAPVFVDGIGQYQGYVSGAQMGLEPYGLERVEVLRGPASGLYGQSAPGGIVNLVSKRPVAQPLRQVELQAGSFDRLQGAFDMGGAATADGTLLFRLTGLARKADGQMDYQKDDRVYIAPALTWQPLPGTTLTLLAHYQKDFDALRPVPLPAYGTIYDNPNGHLPTSRFLGEPEFDSFDRRQWQAGYEFEQQLGAGWAFRQNLQVTDVSHDEDYTYTGYTFGSFPTDLRTVDRFAWDQDNELRTFGVDNQLAGSLDTGPVAHDLLFGLDWFQAHDHWRFSSATMASIDAFAPVYGGPIGPFALAIDEEQSERQAGLYAQDRLRLGNWLLTLDGRQDWFRAKTVDNLAGTETKQSDAAFTGRVGLSYQFAGGVAPYAAYSTSFEPQAGTDAQGDPFKPTTGQQYEIGIKYQPVGGRLFLAASLFDLVRQNVVTSDPNPPATNPFAQVQTGEVRVRGLELEGKAQLAAGLDLTASYSYLDSKVTKSNDANLGRPLFFTPKHQVAVWGDYSFQSGSLAGFGLGGGVRYRSGVWGLDYEIQVPGYTLFDAALHYDLGALTPDLAGARLQLSARNILDKEYVATCSFYEGCYYGDRRTVLATLRYDW